MLLLLTGTAYAAPQRIVVLGGLNGDTVALVSALYAAAPLNSNTIILLPGDATGGDEYRSCRLLDVLATALKGTGARAILIPGKQEWSGGEKGLKALRNHLKAQPGQPVSMPLEAGCPGPDVVKLGEKAVLLLTDSEWWLRDEDERPDIQSDCGTRMPRQILDELEDAISDASGKTVLFATSLNLRGTGIRSGYYGPRQHVFPLTDLPGARDVYVPLPVVGSLYPLARGLFTGTHDFDGRRYAAWMAQMDPVLAEHPSLITIGGAEHVTQLYEEEGRYYVSSGAVHRGGRATNTRHTPFTTTQSGFAILNVEDDGAVDAVFYTRGEGGFSPVYQKRLTDGHPVSPEPALPATAVPSGPDKVSAAVHASYGKAKNMQKLFIGKNYRKDWSTPISLPVFDAGKEGYSFVETGGGNTTTSVRLRDQEGAVWSLRTITKRFDKVLPANFRTTVAEDILRDVGSAAYPWAGELSGRLSDAVGLPRPRVRYVYIPPAAADDTALGGYGPAFAGTVAMLEERQYGWKTGETKGTWKVYDESIDGKPSRIEARRFLRARLFDLVVADYDRHYAQWKWEERKDSTGRKVWWPVPKDRDQAFYRLDGVIARYGLPGNMAYLRGLRPNLTDPAGLSFVARDIDVWGLASLDEADWQEEAKSLQVALTDEKINNAIKALPAELYAVSGAELSQTLRNRRDDLTQASAEYYRFLSHRVTVTGTNRQDSFHIEPVPEGILVSQWTNEKKNDGPVLRYRRQFSRETTSEIRLYGLGADDKFQVQPGVDRSIRIRMIGGSGEDSFTIQSNARAWVYDEAGKGNTITARGAGTEDMISGREDVNRYTFRGNDYNSTALPTAVGGFNIEDGPFIGVGATIVRRGFRVEPYKSRYHVSGMIAPIRTAYAIRAGVTINDAWKHFDFVSNATLVAPALQNFYGLGNETVRDLDKKLSYYRVRYTTFSAEALARKRALDGRLSIAAGPAVFRYSADEDRAEGRVLENPQSVGLDRARVFRSLNYGGARVRIDFNTIDNPLLPVRGALGWADFTTMQGLDGVAKPVTRLESRLDIYSPLSSNDRFVIALRGGGGRILSEDFEYFQALTVGQATGLRGYRKARFAGSSSLWGGAEIRWRALRSRSRYFPADIGLLGFGETGRVWLRGEQSSVWHKDWGAGVFATPFNAILVSAYVAVSPEEALMNFSFGTGVGIVF